VHELTPLRGSLEDAFMELTSDAVEYRSFPSSGGDRRTDPIPVLCR
jgi:hypothetical protein